MRISVIVPAYNSESTLGQCLAAIRSSDYKDFELIVVDDGSRDQSSSIARCFADRTISYPENLGRSHARNMGAGESRGEILLFVDSDVVIMPDTLSKAAKYFSTYEAVDAVTGLLSKEHPNRNFFSQYKNLYMNYIFSKLPEKINFLYGSIHAMRRRAFLPYGGKDNREIRIADDTALGCQLARLGFQISFLRELEVVHLKRYDFVAFVRNDFMIPFEWAKIFIAQKGWRELGKRGTGYLHSPKEQLASVILAPLIVGFFTLSIHSKSLLSMTGALIFIWLLLNHKFFLFLMREKGLLFGIQSVFVTFFDHVIMATGIICGVISKWLFKK